jgi:hypothetical protein
VLDDDEQRAALEVLALPGYAHAASLLAQGAIPVGQTIDGHFVMALGDATWVVDAPRGLGAVEELHAPWRDVVAGIEANDPVSSVIGWDIPEDVGFSIVQCVHYDLRCCKLASGQPIEALRPQTLYYAHSIAALEAELLPAWRDVTSLNDARLPQLLGPPAVGDRDELLGHEVVVPFLHTQCVSFSELFARVHPLGGIAVPLAVGIARDLLGALATLHAAKHSAGALWFGSFGLTASGARILTIFADRLPPPNLSPVGGPPWARYWRGGANAAGQDIRALGAVLFELLTASTWKRNTSHPNSVREDLPRELDRFIATMIDGGGRASARDLLDELERSIAWAKWTDDQMRSEIRALFPSLAAADDYER